MSYEDSEKDKDAKAKRTEELLGYFKLYAGSKWEMAGVIEGFPLSSVAFRNDKTYEVVYVVVDESEIEIGPIHDVETFLKQRQLIADQIFSSCKEELQKMLTMSKEVVH